MSYLVANPEDRFSCDKAHIIFANSDCADVLAHLSLCCLPL